MPISEELLTEFETKSKTHQMPIEQDQETTATHPSNVFLDDNNPLLAQIAIFTRLMELRQSQSE